jgi:hypothetical protein
MEMGPRDPVRWLLSAVLAVGCVSPASRALAQAVVHEIDLPAGFTKIVERGPELHVGGSIKATGYLGPRRSDGSQARLLVTLLELPPEARGLGQGATVEMLVSQEMTALRAEADLGPFKRTDPLVNGVRWARLAWAGHMRNPNDAVSGLSFLGVSGRIGVMMRAQDGGTARRQSLAALDKAMRSLRLKEVPTTAGPAAGGAPASTVPTVRIWVSRGGFVELDGRQVGLAAVESALDDLARRKGVVFYGRDAANEEPHANGMKVMQMVARRRLVLRLSTKRDFSDAVGAEASGPASQPPTR